jgi:hypothetical protein
MKAMDVDSQPKSASVKIVEEYRALMCKRDRTAVSLRDERDARANFQPE